MSLAIVIDISARKQAEETKQFLIREIEHRSNNLLAVVQSIAHQTLSGDHSLEATKAFEARLQALARTNRRLAKSDWSGVNLSEIVRLELEPLRSGRLLMRASMLSWVPKMRRTFRLHCTNSRPTPPNMVHYRMAAERSGFSGRLRAKVWITV